MIRLKSIVLESILGGNELTSVYRTINDKSATANARVPFASN